MSDFDKFFAERLNEEAEFPRREKNWKALSKRLNVYYAAGGASAVVSHLLYWKVAAASLVLVSGLLYWKLRAVQQENTALRKEVAGWQEKSLARDPVAAISPAPGHAGHSDTAPTPENAAAAASGTTAESAPESIRRPSAPASLPPVSPAVRHNEKRSNSKAYSEKTTRPSAPETAQPKADLLASPNAPANGETAPDSIQSAGNKQAGLAGLDLLPGPELPALNSEASQPVNLSPLTPLASTPPVIRPYRDDKSRLRLGAGFVLANPLPKDGGITLPKGAGVNAEFSPLRNLWLTASAEWMGFNADVADSMSRHYLPHKPPKPSKPDHELVHVEGSPRYQQYALGLCYRVPLHFWVQPSVRVAFMWVHKSPAIFSFEFEEDDPGFPGPKPPKYELLAVRTDDEWLHNVWRIGAGLEHDTPRWAFQLGLDYVPGQSASQPTFDALLLQAGVQYKF